MTRARATAGILRIKTRDAEALIVKHLQEGLCDLGVKVVNTPIEDIDTAQKDRRVTLRNTKTMFVNFLSRAKLVPETANLTHTCSVIQDATMTFGLRLIVEDKKGHQRALDIMDETELILSGLILFPKTSVGPLYFTNEIFEDFDLQTNCWEFVQTVEFAYKTHFDVRESKYTVEDCC